MFGRDGGLTKIDLLEMRIVKRVIQSGDSIGGAISPDGKLVAAANYTPGGVKFFGAVTLEQVADIPAMDDNGKPSKVMGLVDAPGHRFVFSLFEAGEIWLVDLRDTAKPVITKFPGIGKEPYDGVITANGRHYLAGLFGEDGLALLDLWHPQAGVKRMLMATARANRSCRCSRCRIWRAGRFRELNCLFPAVGRHEVLIIDQDGWNAVGRIAGPGQPVFVVARPETRHIWVNFAFPDNGMVQVIDAPRRTVIKSLKPGNAVLHMEFTPRGEHVWISARDEDRVDIYDSETFMKVGELSADKPSGIFFTPRAHRIWSVTVLVSRTGNNEA